MTQLDDFGRRYLTVALEIDKHIDGFVDTYYGPPDLKNAIIDNPPTPPAALIEEIHRLQDTIPTEDPARQNYLETTLRAMECSARLAVGERFDYLDEVSRIYDIQPEVVPESKFEAAHATLDTLVPGEATGEPLWQRLDRRRQEYEVETKDIISLIDLARSESRRRTAEFVSLPDDEDVEVKLTNNQPWTAYNWYLGNGRSLIEFNTDLPVNALGILDTFAHEGYPGHHTEAVLKEQTLYHQRGYAEQSAMLLHSPAAVIAEGIATAAMQMIFPGNSRHEWNMEVLFPAAGLTGKGTSIQELGQLSAAYRALRYVSGNAAIQYHTGQLNQDQTIEYIQTYALSSPERAAKSFSFISHPLYRSYIFTYTQGYDLITRTTNPVTTFKRLLVEQITPSVLAGM